MINISDFVDSQNDPALVKQISEGGPWFFYYQKRGRGGEIIGYPPYDDNFVVQFGFHTKLDEELLPLFDDIDEKKTTGKIKHCSPRVDCEMVIARDEEFRFLYSKGNALMSPRDDTKHDFWYCMRPDAYLLFPISEPEEFGKEVFERLGTCGLDRAKAAVMNPGSPLAGKIPMERALDELRDLAEEYGRTGSFEVKYPFKMLRER